MAGFAPSARPDPASGAAGFAGWAGGLLGDAVTSEPRGRVAGFAPSAGPDPAGAMAGFAGWPGGLLGDAVTSEPRGTVADFAPSAGSDPAGGMAGFAGWAGGLLGAVVTFEPRGAVADFAPSTGSDPAGGMAGFGPPTWRANRRYRATVSRSIPNSRAILRCDQLLRVNLLIVCCMSILSWFIAGQGHQTDPDRNDLPHLKMAGFDSPTGGWF